MQIQRIDGQNFQGLQCHPNYDEIQYVLATKLGGYGFDKAIKILDKLDVNKVTSDVYLGGNMEKPKIYAQVGEKLYKENFFYGPISTLKKALKFADKLDKQ